MNTFEKKLDGTWYSKLDPENIGKSGNWFAGIEGGSKEILFPSFIQDSFREYTGGTAWFWNSFEFYGELEDAEAFFKLGFTEYVAEYWLNGKYLGRFDGRMLFYEMECTGAIEQGVNLLAIRISFPDNNELDGYVFNDMPVMYKVPGGSAQGGILYPVRLVIRPVKRLEDIIVTPDYYSGDIALKYKVRGTADEDAISVKISVLSPFGELVADGIDTENIHVDNRVNWDFENPYLYTVIFNLVVNGQVVHTAAVRTGFRILQVKDGWFNLNGKRIVMHATGNSDGFHPLGALQDIYELRNELVHIKSLGFNIVRYHNCSAYPEILDLCDELGIGIWTGHAASWWMKEEGRFFDEIYEHHMVSNIKTCINHPCVIAWEMVNESHFQHEREFSVNALPRIRKIDKTRMVFLGSGRWDRDLRVGSVSNPYSDKWECVWGMENEDAPAPDHAITTTFSFAPIGEWTFKDDDTNCWDPDLGDVHMYTRLPMTFRGKYILRHNSENGKPFILSECGSNAVGDPDTFCRMMEQKHRNLHSEMAEMCRVQEKFFDDEWDRFGLGDIYPVKEDLRLDTFRQCAEVRRAYFDLCRSNPKFAGIQMCMSSTPQSTFGFSDCCRQLYPIFPEMFADVNAPLHWCLFVEPGHVYENKPFTVEAVLSNEDVLGPGEYPVIARMVSKKLGCVWEKKTSFVIEKPKEGEYQPMPIPVIKEEIILSDADEYDISISLLHGGVATGGHRKVTVSPGEGMLDKSITLIGEHKGIEAWFNKHGILTSKDSDTIVIATDRLSDEEWDAIMESVSDGASAYVLCPEVLVSKDVDLYGDWDQYEPDRLPVAKKGILHFVDNWAFRAYTYLKNHKFTEGMPIGVVDDRYYDQTEPIFILRDSQTPDEVVGASLSSPYYKKCDDELHGHISGTTLGVYNLGKGKLIVSCYRILDELGKNPAAGQMLYNMLK